MSEHYTYVRDIIDAAESVGAYIVSIGEGARSGTTAVTVEFPGKYASRVTVDDLQPAHAIRRLRAINAPEADRIAL